MSMGFAMYAPAMLGADIENYAIDPMSQARRVLTFAIGGTSKLAPPAKPVPPPEDPGFAPDRSRVQAGFIGFEMHCLSCHGSSAVGIGNGPDLRRSAIVLDAPTFEKIVRQGTLEERGMAKFPEFSDIKLENIRHYIRSRMADLREGRLGPQQPSGTAIAQ
ncbi:MAG: cytochrome c, partial [Novosphingobium sp.]|nr:cytochrome c [Novosphingobium sp.]